MKLLIKFLAGGLLAAVLPATAQNFYWAGQGASLNWNDAGNWNPSVPDASSIAWFEDLLYTTGYTNAAGVVNSVVTNNVVAGAANYVANSFSTTNHFYTTLISTGASLTLGGFGASYPALSVGDVLGPNSPTLYPCRCLASRKPPFTRAPAIAVIKNSCG